MYEKSLSELEQHGKLSLGRSLQIKVTGVITIFLISECGYHLSSTVQKLSCPRYGFSLIAHYCGLFLNGAFTIVRSCIKSCDF